MALTTRRRGRPPRADGRATRRIEFRVTAQEYDEIRQLAGGGPVADAVRLLVLGEIAESLELLPVVIPAGPQTVIEPAAARSRR